MDRAATRPGFCTSVVSIASLILFSSSAFAQTPPPISFAGVQSTVQASGLYQPTGVAVDAAGDVFFSDSNSNSVLKLPAGGGTAVTVASGLSTPQGIAADAFGDVFIAQSEQQHHAQINFRIPRRH